jgi:hypothetical protein
MQENMLQIMTLESISAERKAHRDLKVRILLLCGKSFSDALRVWFLVT